MRFEVETSSLESTIDSMDAELDKIGQISKRLYTALEVLDSMWVGAAHDVFAVQYQSDQQKLSQMCKTISGVLEGLDEARRTYEQCEQSVETEIKKIRV